MFPTDICPEAVVLRGRSTAPRDFVFEVRNLANGELILAESPARVTSWLGACGYSWVYGSSGVWTRKTKARLPRCASAPRRAGRRDPGGLPSRLAGAA